MGMNYDRRAKVQFESVLFQAAAADKHVRDAYLALHSFKAGMDAMEEIPPHITPLYSQTMKALDKLHTTMDETYQLSQMTNKMLRSLGH